MTALTIDANRLANELAELAKISAEPSPVVTRVVFTEADLRARKYLQQLCEEAGLTIRHDAIGNTFARWTGADPSLPAVATGSHIDAIPNAGSYDGTVGVLGGLEAIRALQSAGIKPKRSIELILFTSEEPTRFGIGCLGSRLLAGTLAATVDETLHDHDGLTLQQARTQAGFTGDLASIRLPEKYYSAFVELHIEQGPLLEQHSDDIGIVTAIAAPATLRLELAGEGGHAGAMLMPIRRDAFLAAAEIALAVERAALATGAPDTVATTGFVQVFPGAVNSVPSLVKLEIDVRDIDETRRDQVVTQIQSAALETCRRRKIGCEMKLLNSDPPATCAPEIIAAIHKACVAYDAAAATRFSLKKTGVDTSQTPNDKSSKTAAPAQTQSHTSPARWNPAQTLHNEPVKTSDAQLTAAEKSLRSPAYLLTPTEKSTNPPDPALTPTSKSRNTPDAQTPARPLRAVNMISRAYHDSLFMSRIATTAMIFIPSRNGVSHRPDEYSSPESIAQGAWVLAATLAELAK